ncbi:MAG: LPS assembly protein LptD, partial [Desulfobacterales bacterium]
MSRLQNSCLLRQDCINDYGKVFLCSKYKASFLALVAYTQKKYEVLKLARIPKAIACVSLALLILIVTSHFASAEGKAPLFKDDPTVPWHIVADEIHYDDRANQYIAKGNVTITKQDRNLSADYVRFDEKNMKAFANGHVIMTVGQDILTGSRMEMDLNTETGTVYNGTIFLQENHFFIKGDKLKKVGKDSYTADKASITTCDGDRPAWKITGRNLKVTIEGYGFVKHAALWAKKIPVLYTPFLFFPAKLKRQSGLLPPQFGYSDRKGTEYIQPVYWAINQSSDATFYLDYMAHRGEKLGLEYRYVLDERSKGTLMYDFFNDEKVDDGSFDSSEKWGYEDDNFLRPNSSRYWFRMKHDQALPFDFSARLDLDIVSDQDYLLEFKDGLTGFKQTDSYFLETFGRDLDDNDDPVRTNSLNLNRIWPAYSLNAEVLWY